MAFQKKPMTENEKKAKLTALKGAHGEASKHMTQSLYAHNDRKDSKSLKDHVKEMTEDTGIDFKGDSDKIVDPQHEGNVIGRHISDENDDIETSADHSGYDPEDADSIEARIQQLMKRK